jgi:hypothetical protein
MNIKIPWFSNAVLVLGLATAFTAELAKPLYENDFSQIEPGKMPEDLLVIDGQFAVRQEGDNRFLELPGAPLETYGVLFGPTEKEGLAVSARIFGTAKGRRFPAFGVSLNGVSGYRLQVAPGRRQLELLKGEQVLASASFAWGSGQWTHFKLQVRKLAEGGWRIEGKAWPQGGGSEQEPDSWTVTVEEKGEPAAGRSGLWGSPFSGTAIRFDDVKVSRASAER